MGLGKEARAPCAGSFAVLALRGASALDAGRFVLLSCAFVALRHPSAEGIGPCAWACPPSHLGFYDPLCLCLSLSVQVCAKPALFTCAAPAGACCRGKHRRRVGRFALSPRGRLTFLHAFGLCALGEPRLDSAPGDAHSKAALALRRIGAPRVVSGGPFLKPFGEIWPKLGEMHDCSAAWGFTLCIFGPISNGEAAKKRLEGSVAVLKGTSIVHFAEFWPSFDD